MVRARIVAALLAVTQLGCSLAFVPRPPPAGARCSDVASVALPLLDGVVAVGALGYGTLRTVDPLCDTTRPCAEDEKDFGALVFGLLVAAPFVVSSVLGFVWRDECQDREPKPRVVDDAGE